MNLDDWRKYLEKIGFLKMHFCCAGAIMQYGHIAAPVVMCHGIAHILHCLSARAWAGHNDFSYLLRHRQAATQTINVKVIIIATKMVRSVSLTGSSFMKEDWSTVFGWRASVSTTPSRVSEEQQGSQGL